MKTSQESQSTPEIKPQVSRESQSDQQNNRTDAVVGDSGSISTSSNDNKKVSRQDIELVQNLIERCLQLYMNKDEVVKTLLSRAKIAPSFTTLVWQKLEEENADFFRAYYIRLKLKKQILLFNQLLEHQYHLMKYPPPKVPLPPIQNGVHPLHVNHLPMGYPIHPHPPMQAASQHHMDTMGMVNGVPSPGNFHPMQMNSAMDMAVDNSVADVAPTLPPGRAMSSMSDMPLSPLSATSSGHFPFSTPGVDTSALDTAFASEVADTLGLQIAPDDGAENCRDSYRSLDQMTWNFSLSDLTADLSNWGDLDALGNYPGSPFLPSDSDLLLDSPEQDDIEEFFVDSVPEGSPADEKKS